MPTGASLAAAMLRPFHVLVIDDSVADLELTRAAVEIVDASVRVTTAASWADLPLSVLTVPLDVILVDAHMPGIDGFAVLQRLKSDPALRVIPVIVRSGSEVPEDIARAFREQASAYILKPTGFEALVEQVQALLGFWRLNRTLSGRSRLG